ncbi:LuxR C-terminal-related transcriptional regulator [Hoeflea sp.]|uniref:LuxR C-terminal-related transcriptional regulator n=1 Tax=Hoeflea sp. TaxID=1940281 RepID=UPI003B02D54D
MPPSPSLSTGAPTDAPSSGPPVENDDDRREILDLLERETAAFFEKDYDTWADCWLKSPDSLVAQASVADGMRVQYGFEQYRMAMQDRFARFPEPNTSFQHMRRENMRINVGADMAWATFDQIGVDTGDAFDLAGIQHELRILHKVNGRWKIACLMVMQRSIDQVHHPLIEVDEAMRVLWMNAPAKTLLGDLPEVTLTHGRLKARDERCGEALQEAVLKLSRANRERVCFIPKNEGVIPVALAEDDYGVPQFCWVTCKDDKILISFNDASIVEQRIGWARQVYGFSSTQTSIIRLILEGHDVAEAAEDLGISVNTVRTHLQRIYDKTGARSRHALVQAVFVVEPPLA